MSTVKAQPALDERFIMNFKGKDFVLYAGLLDLAHQKGLKSIWVEPLQYPTKVNGMEGICKATVTSMNGNEFVEVGDANPKNVNRMIAEHILRMAATRAKARALRDFTNIGITCLEELGELEDEVGEKPHRVGRLTQIPKTKGSTDGKKRVPDSKDPDAHPKKETEKKAETAASGPPGTITRISTAQLNAIMNLSKRRGIVEEDLNKMAEDTYGVLLEALSASDASNFIRQLQVAA